MLPLLDPPTRPSSPSLLSTDTEKQDQLPTPPDNPASDGQSSNEKSEPISAVHGTDRRPRDSNGVPLSTFARVSSSYFEKGRPSVVESRARESRATTAVSSTVLSTYLDRSTQTTVDQATQTIESFLRPDYRGNVYLEKPPPELLEEGRRSRSRTSRRRQVISWDYPSLVHYQREGDDAASASDSNLTARPRSPDAPPPVTLSPFKRLAGWRLVVVEICLCLGLLLSIVDASIVATALVPIEFYFNEFFESIWVVLSYLLAYMAFSLLWARFSDILGRKWMVVSAWVIFTGFSLACGLANSLEQLIIFRALQGVGGSGLYSLCNVLIPEITPRKHFATMSAATGVVFAISSVLGPVLGGVIAQNSSWRWIFLLNVPCGVVATLILVVCWPSPANPWPSTWIMLKALAHHVDFVGTLLLLSFTVLLVFGMEEAGAAKYEWSSPVIIGTLAAAGAGLVLLIVWTVVLDLTKGLIPINPILPVRLLSNRILAAAFLSTLFTGFPLFLTIVTIPERFQIVNGLDATQAGVRLMPLLFSSALGSTIGGFLSSKRNRTFFTLTFASCLMVLGCGLLSTASDGLAIENSIYGYQVIFGFGLGMTFTTVTIIASTESKFADYATSLGVVNQARIFGGAIGLAASTIILNVRLWNDLSPVMSFADLTGLRQSLSYIPLLTPEQQYAVSVAFANSFDDQMRYCTYIAAACVIISLFTFSRNPTDLEKRKALGEALLAGRVSLVDADRELGHLRRPMFGAMGQAPNASSQ